MLHRLFSRERTLVCVCLALVAVAVLGPAVGNPAHYHAFADQRTWNSIPHAWDVLSNLSFAIWGWLGLSALARLPRFRIGREQRRTTTLFFLGLLTTTLGSGYYHLQPSDAALLWDRLGMVLAFAGLMGSVAAGHVSERAGRLLGWGVLVAGPLALVVSQLTANMLPWAALQFGGLAMVLWMANLEPVPGALPVRWGVVILVYVLAKCLELGDHIVFEALGQTVSGHSLKHMVASLAAWPIWAGVREAAATGHNPLRMIIGQPPQPPYLISGGKHLQEPTCR